MTDLRDPCQWQPLRWMCLSILEACLLHSEKARSWPQGNVSSGASATAQVWSDILDADSDNVGDRLPLPRPGHGLDRRRAWPRWCRPLDAGGIMTSTRWARAIRSRMPRSSCLLPPASCLPAPVVALSCSGGCGRSIESCGDIPLLDARIGQRTRCEGVVFHRGESCPE